MTVSAYSKSGPTVGNGNTGQEFAFTFDFYDTSEIVATERVTATGAETVLTETTDYTIESLVGSDPYTGGTLTLAGSKTIAASSTLTISRSSTQTQATDLVASGALPSDTLEDQFDKLVMICQELQEQLNRCLKIPVSDGAARESGTEIDNSAIWPISKFQSPPSIILLSPNS